MPSTRELWSLPAIDDLRRLCQSVALLDAIIEPDPELRYFFFDSKWDKDEMAGYMKTGEGEQFHILFSSAGAILIGSAPNSTMGQFAIDNGHPWPGVIDDVPAEFADALAEPAFVAEEASFCIWRRSSDVTWSIGNIDYPVGEDPDGSHDLLFVLDGNPKTYKKWAEEYHERRIPVNIVKYIYDHKPLTDHVFASLNPDRTIEDLRSEIAEIGY